jgi:hypothetical protein
MLQILFHYSYIAPERERERERRERGERLMLYVSNALHYAK